MVCPQGATFNKVLTYSIDGEPVNLTTYSARMQVREKYTSTNPEINISTINGGIVLGGAAGTITINIVSSETRDLAAKDYVYDLELVSSSNIVIRLIEGKFIVTPEVTR
jgi:hypothetical protein